MDRSALSQPTVSAVVATYQRRDTLEAVVHALLEDPAVLEVIAVDDGSTDGTVEWLAQCSADDDRVRGLSGPRRGAAAARQVGLEAARGDVVLFLDDDVVPAPGLAGRHAHRHAKRPDVLVLGYMPNDWRRLAPDRRAVGLIYRRAYEAACVSYERDPHNVLLKLWGGNFSLRRVDALRAGLRTPCLGDHARHEDRELGLRCLRAGLHGAFDRALRADHRYSRDLAGFRRDSRRSGRERRRIAALLADLEDADPVAVAASMPQMPLQRLPRPVRGAWRLLACDPLFPATAAALSALLGAMVGRADVRLQTLPARALGALEAQRGLIEDRPPHRA